MIPVLNVSDFGALGDGVTDDSAAIQAAVDAAAIVGGTVWIAPVPASGFYLVSVPIVLRSGVTIQGHAVTGLPPIVGGDTSHQTWDYYATPKGGSVLSAPGGVVFTQEIGATPAETPSLVNCNLRDLVIINSDSIVSVGAHGCQSFQQSFIHNIVGLDIHGVAFALKNFAHLDMRDIYVVRCHYGTAFDCVQDMDASYGLNSGNSQFKNIYVYAPSSVTTRPVFHVRVDPANTGGIFGGCLVENLQVNHYVTAGEFQVRLDGRDGFQVQGWVFRGTNIETGPGAPGFFLTNTVLVQLIGDILNRVDLGDENSHCHIFSSHPSSVVTFSTNDPLSVDSTHLYGEFSGVGSVNGIFPYGFYDVRVGGGPTFRVCANALKLRGGVVGQPSFESEFIKEGAGGSIGMGGANADALTIIAAGNTAMKHGLTIGSLTTGMGDVRLKLRNTDENGAAFGLEIPSKVFFFHLKPTETVFNNYNGNPFVWVSNSAEIMRATFQALVLSGALKTAAPGGGAAKPWKFGAVTAGGVEVEIDGVPLKLAVVP